MTVLGHVINGVIVPDAPLGLPEGTAVRLEVLAAATPTAQETDNTNNLGEIPTLYDRLVSFIGAAKDLPPDLAENHDHYLYGTPKRT